MIFKNSQQTRNRRALLQLDKGASLQKPTVNIILHEKWNAFSL